MLLYIISPSALVSAFLAVVVKLCSFRGVFAIVVLVVACSVSVLALVNTGAPA